MIATRHYFTRSIIPETHTLTYTNAGIWRRFPSRMARYANWTRAEQWSDLFEETPYIQVTLCVPPGSLLVAFSDGLTEAANAYGEEFGTQRLKEQILRNRDMPAQQLMQSLIDASGNGREAGTSGRHDGDRGGVDKRTA